MKYARIITECYGRVWALPEDLLARMQQFLSEQASGAKFSTEEIRERIADSNTLSGYQARDHDRLPVRYSARTAGAGSERSGGGGNSSTVALIPIIGIISHRMNLVNEISSGGTSIQKLQAQFRQAMADVNCKAIVLDVDSPGGSVDGVLEFASEIYDARRQKPITAVCNSMACSAAYWLASAASEVVCTPTGQCGSIGVYVLHQDESEALKKDGIKITIIKAGKLFSATPSSDIVPFMTSKTGSSKFSSLASTLGEGERAPQRCAALAYGIVSPEKVAVTVRCTSCPRRE